MSITAATCILVRIDLLEGHMSIDSKLNSVNDIFYQSPEIAVLHSDQCCPWFSGWNLIARLTVDESEHVSCFPLILLH